VARPCYNFRSSLYSIRRKSEVPVRTGSQQLDPVGSGAVARTPEGEIQAAICDYLTLRRVFFVRLNNIPAMYRDDAGSLRFRKMGKYARPGLSDILAVKGGRAIFIEVKTKDGKLSDEQHEFGRDVVLAGSEYIVARGIEDVERAGL
jgi:hypothetical protein